MNKDRIKKLESVVIELTGNFFTKELDDIMVDFGIINIAGVKISSDLSYLDIYVNSFKNQEGLTKTLALHAHDLQRYLNKKLNIRKLPRVRFRYDEKGEIAQEVSKTINNL